MLYGVNEEKKAAVLEALENMELDELLAAWNEYAREYRYDDEIFTLDEFSDLIADRPATWLMDRIYYGDYNPSADLITFNGCGNIQSVTWAELTDYMDYDELAEYYAGDLPHWAWIPEQIAEALEELEEPEETDTETA